MEAVRDLALMLSSNWRRELPRVQSLNAQLMACVLARSGKKVIVDSSKIGIRLKYLLRNPALDVRILRLVRDGRGVALTYVDPERFADASDPRWRGGGAGAGRDDERISMADASREWLRSNEEAEALLSGVDRSKWMEVRYESLCSQPAETLRQIHQFLGLSKDEQGGDFRRVEHHVVGNGMRLDTHSEIRLDERWRENLKPEDLQIFDSIAGAMNRKLGYT